MTELKDQFQSADWRTEKHVPVIECADTFKKGEMTSLTITIGKEVAHPNTTEHHIVWVAAYFHPDGEKYPYELGKIYFGAHGASVQGPDTSTVYTHHGGTFMFKTDKPGTILAESLCNIHGLWQNNKKISVE